VGQVGQAAPPADPCKAEVHSLQSVRVRSAAFIFVVASFARAADTPATLVSGDEAEPIHSAVTRQEAWTQDPVRRLRLDAERYLKEGVWTVTADRPKAIDLDPHEYYSESPAYWPDAANPAGPYLRRSGQPNPSVFTANRAALGSMCDTVFALGTAAYLLDDPRYASHAVRVIQTWFILPKTRMDPNMQHAGTIPGSRNGAAFTSGGVSEGRPLIRAIQGMEFLAKSGAWDPKEEAATRKWFEDYLRWLTPTGPPPADRPADNPIWRLALEAAVATFTEDAAAQRRVFDSYRGPALPRPPRAAPGAAVNPPAQALATNLEARAMICRIAQLHGVDLWSVPVRSGGAIATAIDSLEASLADPKQWTKEQSAGFQSNGVYLMAFAGMGLNKPDYVAEFHKLERPENAWLALVDLLVERWEAAAHQTRH
jgi:hypothetical protein